MMDENLGLQCNTYPSDSQTRKAKRFGEGFTWTCPDCFKRFVLKQGKGNYWFWSDEEEING